MHPKDVESIQKFALETAAALVRIGKAHYQLYDRVEVIEKTLLDRITTTPADGSEGDRLRARVAELEEALALLNRSGSFLMAWWISQHTAETRKAY